MNGATVKIIGSDIFLGSCDVWHVILFSFASHFTWAIGFSCVRWHFLGLFDDSFSVPVIWTQNGKRCIKSTNPHNSKVITKYNIKEAQFLNNSVPHNTVGNMRDWVGAVEYRHIRTKY